jgi:hypothetical protein
MQLKYAKALKTINSKKSVYIYIYIGLKSPPRRKVLGQ